jgi:hypothetical protein
VKPHHRSAIAVVAASLLGGTGVSVAAAHLSAQTQQDAASTAEPAPAATATTTDLVGRIHDLIAGTHQMNSRLVVSRQVLARQLHELTRLREQAAAQRVTAMTTSAVTSARAVVPAPASPPPPVHTSTGASGASGSSDDQSDGPEQEHGDD